ncbi:MAG: YmdB family metallophosphoesterase [Clostridia bacterium]|nr:YmdB family metallophosphoesterase [Clostridia bacterium]
MKILALGDIVGPKSVEELGKKLWSYRKENKIDFVVANGENASRGNGLDPDSAQNILDYGVDVITSGNHIWQKNSLRDFLDSNKNIVRPINFPSTSAGSGYTIVDCSGYKMLVINVSGTIYMESLSCPFDAVERVLEKEKGNYDVSVLDIHAEATSEKYALARYFDGKIDVVFGTHTHVPTADNQVLPGGTGYITDLGMCGPKNSILGVRSEIIIEKLRTKMPVRFEFDEENIVFNGAIFDVDVDTSGRVTVNSVKRAEF